VLEFSARNVGPKVYTSPRARARSSAESCPDKGYSKYLYNKNLDPEEKEIGQEEERPLYLKHFPERPREKE